MMSMKALTLSYVLLAICKCEGDMGEMHGEFIKLMRKCHTENGFTDEMRQKMRKQNHDGVNKLEDVPKEYLCSIKCIDEKLEIIKDGKYDMKTVQKNQMLMESLITPDKYLKCLEAIDGLKECEDYRKKVKCDNEFGETHMRKCALKFNIDERNFSNRRREERPATKDKNRQCFDKCLYESKGILNKDGKMVVEKAQKDMHIMWRVKNKDQFLSCLKDLEIKECEDISKICECKKNSH